MEGDFRVLEIKEMAKLPSSAEAKRILEKVCWQVQPIMRKRRWCVPLVVEFLPRSAGLLGLNTNAGEKISIRMRQTKDSAFFPFEDLLGTMLHELVHNEIGPHNAKFYALLDELQKECDGLMDRNVGGSGAGFDLPGTKLSNEAHNPSSMRDARLKALKAAEVRLQKQQLMGGGQRLGGRPPPANRTPAQMAAEAAIRRSRDDLWCHTDSVESGAESSGAKSVAKTQDSDNNSASSKVSQPPESSEKPVSSVASSGLNARPNSNKQPTPARSTSRHVESLAGSIDHSAPAKRPKLQSGGVAWQCAVCTLVNEASLLRCKVCDAPPPVSVPCQRGAANSKGLVGGRWKCKCNKCTEGLALIAPGSSAKQRPCQVCTYMNSADGTRKCGMCGAELLETTGATHEQGDVILLD